MNIGNNLWVTVVNTCFEYCSMIGVCYTIISHRIISYQKSHLFMVIMKTGHLMYFLGISIAVEQVLGQWNEQCNVSKHNSFAKSTSIFTVCSFVHTLSVFPCYALPVCVSSGCRIFQDSLLTLQQL